MNSRQVSGDVGVTTGPGERQESSPGRHDALKGAFCFDPRQGC